MGTTVLSSHKREMASLPLRARVAVLIACGLVLGSLLTVCVVNVTRESRAPGVVGAHSPTLSAVASCPGSCGGCCLERAVVVEVEGRYSLTAEHLLTSTCNVTTIHMLEDARGDPYPVSFIGEHGEEVVLSVGGGGDLSYTIISQGEEGGATLCPSTLGDDDVALVPPSP